MTAPHALMPLDEALARVARDYGPVTGVETAPLATAAGRILAEPLAAPFDVPPAAVSAMDGYAFAASAEHVPEGSLFRLAGRVPAGHMTARTVGAGEAVRIFTGAVLPPGTDTVAIQEECRAEEGAVGLTAAVGRGANVRPAGEDMRAGAVVLPAGRRLRPQEIGLAAAMGRVELPVRGRLRVALFSTGDELREPGTAKPPGAIYDANRRTVGAQLAALGTAVRDLGILPDRPDAVRAALAEAAGSADLIVTSGGASVGEEDHVKAAVAALGGIDLWKLALRPGKPLALGRIGSAVVLGLPGNPVSAMVTFMLVGRPLVLRLAGAEPQTVPRGLVVAEFEHRKRPGRREFLRARLVTAGDGRPAARLFPNDSSGVLTSMAEADGLIDVPAETTGVRPGELVAFLPFSGLLG